MLKEISPLDKKIIPGDTLLGLLKYKSQLKRPASSYKEIKVVGETKGFSVKKLNQ